jgi:hypothetical protein
MRKIDKRFYYHVYNRGVDKRKIFMDHEDHIRFLESLVFFNYADNTKDINALKIDYKIKGTELSLLDVQRPIGPKLVEIIGYCLSENHYHLILKELIPGGIPLFMKRVNDGYTKYFNFKYSRTGSLLESRYKCKEFRNVEHILKLSVYVNGNAEIHQINNFENWLWTSKYEYLGGGPDHNICNVDFVLNEFGKTEEEQKYKYEKFFKKQLKKSRERKELLKDME